MVTLTLIKDNEGGKYKQRIITQHTYAKESKLPYISSSKWNNNLFSNPVSLNNETDSLET